MPKRTKPLRGALNKTDQRELARQLGAMLDRVYDGTLDANGPVAANVARRMEGAKAILDATVEPESSPKKTRRRR